jgi:hypothetical protein
VRKPREKAAAAWNLRLASYNIRKAVGLDWKRRPERILAVLDEFNADVVVLQEADKRLGNRPAAIPAGLLATHGTYEPIDPGPGPSLGWHGNAILLRRGLRGEVVDLINLPGLSLVAPWWRGCGGRSGEASSSSWRHIWASTGAPVISRWVRS